MQRVSSLGRECLSERYILFYFRFSCCWIVLKKEAQSTKKKGGEIRATWKTNKSNKFFPFSCRLGLFTLLPWNSLLAIDSSSHPFSLRLTKQSLKTFLKGVYIELISGLVHYNFGSLPTAASIPNGWTWRLLMCRGWGRMIGAIACNRCQGCCRERSKGCFVLSFQSVGFRSSAEPGDHVLITSISGVT